MLYGGVECHSSCLVVGVQIHPGIGGLPCGSNPLLKSPVVQFANLLLSLCHLPTLSKHLSIRNIHTRDSIAPQPAPPLIPPIFLNDTFINPDIKLRTPHLTISKFYEPYFENTARISPLLTTSPLQVIHSTFVSHLPHGNLYQLCIPTPSLPPPPSNARAT